MRNHLARSLALGTLLVFAACRDGGEGASTEKPAPAELAPKPTPTVPVEAAPTPPAVGACGDVNKNDGLAACEALCATGDAKACGIAGQIHIVEDDEAVADKNAAPLLTKACDGNDGAGCQWLAAFHANGLGGIPKDAAKATALSKKACDLGAKAACPSKPAEPTR